MSNSYQKPNAPWTKTLTPLTTEESDDNKWNLLYNLCFIQTAGYAGDNLELALNHISERVPDLLNLVSKMGSNPLFKTTGLISEFDAASGTPTEGSGTPADTIPHSSSSSSIQTQRLALIHSTFTAMVQEYFKGDTSTSNSMVESFLLNLIHTSHTKCPTLGALYNTLSQILKVLSWFWGSFRFLGTTEKTNLLQFTTNNCLTKFYDHCGPAAGLLKMSVRSHSSSGTNTDQWIALKKALSEQCVSGAALAPRPSLVTTPSFSMHANPAMQQQSVPPPPDTPYPGSADLSQEMQAQIEKKVLSLFSSHSSAGSPSSRDHKKQRDRSPSPRRSRDRDRDRDRDRYRQRSPPSRPRDGHRSKSRPLCRDFGRGHCTYGNKCRFEHSNQSTNTPTSDKYCFQYRKHGTCRYGSNCNYSHSSQPSANNSSPDKKNDKAANKQIKALTAHINTLVSSATEQQKQLASLSAFAESQKAAAAKAARDAEIRQQAFVFYQQQLASQLQPSGSSSSGQSVPLALTDNSSTIPLLGFIPPKN